MNVRILNGHSPWPCSNAMQPRRPRWPLAVVAGLVLGMGPAVAQEDEADEDEANTVELVVVTGSRLVRQPSELSREVIVLDREDIVASGELTLPRLLRQVPQNVNATSEVFGSKLNNVTNVSAASTVNLRGLGSESTLVLVDGRRVGYSGILGGVTDISTIPLAMVERVEILLDGASAVYGSDAVGGVVNIITRRDYAGIELDIDYGRPSMGGYDEVRGSIAGGWAWDGGRAVVGYEHFEDSGLDASSRDTIIHANRNDQNNQKGGLAGPQFRAYTWFFDNSCDANKAIVYVYEGAVITREQYAALDPASQRAAECHADVTLPKGFQPGDDLNGIQIFGAPNWGEDAEFGFSLRPEQVHDSINVGVDQSLGNSITLHANMRYTRKDTHADSGLSTVSGTFAAGNPFNPFNHRVSLRGQLVDAPARAFVSEKEDLFTRVGLEGVFGDSGWTWQAEFGRAQEELAAQRINEFDASTVSLGLNSDGVTEAVIARIGGISADECEARRAELGGTRISYSTFFGGNCTIYGPPPDPINPFGDLSEYVAAGLNTNTSNEQTQFEALTRGELFDIGGGPVALVVGYDYREDMLDTMSEFHATGGFCSAVSCPTASPAGALAFDTRIARTNHSAFFEGLAPLVGGANAMRGVQSLLLTFTGRYDSYPSVDVAYRESQSGDAGTKDVADPGSEFTWGLGLVYRPSDRWLLKADVHTAFVAPQLNQLVARVREREPAAAFQGLYFTQPDALGRTQAQGNVFNNEGGNDKLVPETAETMSFAVEYTPLDRLLLKANYSDTQFINRIAYLRTFTVDPFNLPGNVVYDADTDTYLRDNRWVNVGRVDRNGVDLEARYDWPLGGGEASIVARRSHTLAFDVQVDAAIPETQSILATRDDVSYDRDSILPPVPKSQTYVQLGWARGGLQLHLDMQTATPTTVIRSGGGDGFEYTTEPSRSMDAVAVYDFGQGALFDAPDWMAGMRATLTVNNVTNVFTRNYRTDRELRDNNAFGHTEDYTINPFYEWTQGRAYRLTLHKSF